ncbi:basic proline-rich protein-like [Strigops habroptila]|uniref:basic proline-rich protein-like n=1 Tax=Strigops habroptila TaxID=2489341 RepID=UPI0011CFB66F|nr:basic proline-rich protein-like [Strigops habroptila]
MGRETSGDSAEGAKLRPLGLYSRGAGEPAPGSMAKPAAPKAATPALSGLDRPPPAPCVQTAPPRRSRPLSPRPARQGRPGSRRPPAHPRARGVPHPIPRNRRPCPRRRVSSFLGRTSRTGGKCPAKAPATQVRPGPVLYYRLTPAVASPRAAWPRDLPPGPITAPRISRSPTGPALGNDPGAPREEKPGAAPAPTDAPRLPAGFCVAGAGAYTDHSRPMAKSSVLRRPTNHFPECKRASPTPKHEVREQNPGAGHLLHKVSSAAVPPPRQCTADQPPKPPSAHCLSGTRSPRPPPRG